METAKVNTKWLEGLGNGTKVVRLQFGVVIHRTRPKHQAARGLNRGYQEYHAETT